MTGKDNYNTKSLPRWGSFGPCLEAYLLATDLLDVELSTHFRGKLVFFMCVHYIAVTYTTITNPSCSLE